MKFLDQKTIFITGGTGTFGNALIDRLKGINTKIIVFSRDEKKQHDMLVTRMHENIEYIIGDVRNKNKLIRCLRGIDFVFHAAALKHVPTGEKFPEEVIDTDILGAKNVIEAAEECRVKKIVNLSTDKAVAPINAYGMSKALAEKLIYAHKGNTVCVNLRYGNVLGSRGSVLPLFLNQIKNNLPLTITNPNMTRFLLPLKHAVDLALKCLKDSKDGDLFVIKSPACKIGTLVEALELHFKKKFKKKIIGIRPGEKIHEMLLTAEEVFRASEIEENKIKFVRVPRLEANIKDYFFTGEGYEMPEPFTSANTVQYDSEKTLNLIKEAGLL